MREKLLLSSLSLALLLVHALYLDKTSRRRSRWKLNKALFGLFSWVNYCGSFGYACCIVCHGLRVHWATIVSRDRSSSFLLKLFSCKVSRTSTLLFDRGLGSSLALAFIWNLDQNILFHILGYCRFGGAWVLRCNFWCLTLGRLLKFFFYLTSTQSFFIGLICLCFNLLLYFFCLGKHTECARSIVRTKLLIFFLSLCFGKLHLCVNLYMFGLVVVSRHLVWKLKDGIVFVKALILSLAVFLHLFSDRWNLLTARNDLWEGKHVVYVWVGNIILLLVVARLNSLP